MATIIVYNGLPINKIITSGEGGAVNNQCQKK